jgi:hypothetical protein
MLSKLFFYIIEIIFDLIASYDKSTFTCLVITRCFKSSDVLTLGGYYVQPPISNGHGTYA